jgi:hypothetical protein
MKNMRRLIFFIAISVTSIAAFAAHHTEKTFLSPQSIRMPGRHILHDYVTNLVRNEEVLGWDHVEVSYFGWRQHAKELVGEYFGRNNKNVITVGSAKTDFPSANFIFTQNPQNLTLAGEFKLAPYRKVVGFHFNYLKRMSFISDKLFLNVYTPIVKVTHCMGACARDESTDIVDGNKVGVLSFFSGELSQGDGPTKQENLKYATIPCCTQFSKSGFADVNCELGYRWGQRNYYVRPIIGVVLPTGNKSEGKTLFEPMLGNGRQWGMGIGLEAMRVLEIGKDTIIDLTGFFKLKHFFSNTQKRTIGFLSDDWGSRRIWSYYELIGEHGKKGVFPAANVLTRDVKVQQGLICESGLNLNFIHRNFMLNIGYDYFSRAMESVSVKCWEDNKYALVSTNYDATNNFNIVADPNPATDDNLQGPIQRESLDVSVAQTPAQDSHRIYGTISYARQSIPLNIGIGAAYEYCQKNSALRGYELYLKLNISF